MFLTEIKLIGYSKFSFASYHISQCLCWFVLC